MTGYPLFGSVDFLLPAPYRTAPPSADSVSSLLELGLYEKLFEEILRQLEGRGLLVQEGAIVDATIVESSRRPRKAMEIMPEDRKEEKTDMPSAISYSDDT